MVIPLIVLWNKTLDAGYLVSDLVGIQKGVNLATSNTLS